MESERVAPTTATGRAIAVLNALTIIICIQIKRATRDERVYVLCLLYIAYMAICNSIQHVSRVLSRGRLWLFTATIFHVFLENPCIDTTR